jgi:hypothetical protein
VKNKGDFEEFEVNGKKIIGSKESIEALKKHLKPRSPPKEQHAPREQPKQRVKDSKLSSMLKDLNIDVKDDLAKLDDLQKVLLTCLFGK